MAFAGRLLVNFALTMPLLPWARITFPQITRVLLGLPPGVTVFLQTTRHTLGELGSIGGRGLNACQHHSVCTSKCAKCDFRLRYHGLEKHVKQQQSGLAATRLQFAVRLAAHSWARKEDRVAAVGWSVSVSLFIGINNPSWDMWKTCCFNVNWRWMNFFKFGGPDLKSLTVLMWPMGRSLLLPGLAGHCKMQIFKIMWDITREHYQWPTSCHTRNLLLTLIHHWRFSLCKHDNQSGKIWRQDVQHRRSACFIHSDCASRYLQVFSVCSSRLHGHQEAELHTPTHRDRQHNKWWGTLPLKKLRYSAPEEATPPELHRPIFTLERQYIYIYCCLQRQSEL